MILTLTTYPTYKDSGVPWLGEVPTRWEVKPLKRWVRINAAVLPDTTAADYQFRYIDIGTVGTGFLIKEPQQMRFSCAPSRARRVLHSGDTIVSTVRTYLKAVYHVVGEADALVCSTGFAVLTPGSGTQPKYVSYLVQSNFLTDRITAESAGTAYPAIAEGRLGSFHVPIPPFSEQTAIVRFLNYMDRRIRLVIRARQRRIKLLEEYKQVLIHRTVTGQIDVRTGQPYPAYKPSGVPWLGEVPAHWEVLPGHRCFVERKQPNIGLMETTVLSLSYGRIVVKPVEKLRGLVPTSFETYQIVDSGDIVCRPTDLQNDQKSLRFGLVRNRGIITSAYMSLRTTERLDSNFGYLLLHIYDVRKIFYGLGSGLRQNLDWRDFKRLPCLVPPLSEQTTIVEYLDTQTTKIDAAIATTRREIELLREYRTRLIADVVTGKVDVREVAAQLPEEEAGSEEDSDEFTDLEAPEEGGAVEEGTEETPSEEEVTV